MESVEKSLGETNSPKSMMYGRRFPPSKGERVISQFWMISLLSVEGKVFFSVVAQRRTRYLEKNNLIENKVQKEGIPDFEGCLENTSMI